MNRGDSENQRQFKPMLSRERLSVIGSVLGLKFFWDGSSLPSGFEATRQTPSAPLFKKFALTSEFLIYFSNRFRFSEGGGGAGGGHKFFEGPKRNLQG